MAAAAFRTRGESVTHGAAPLTLSDANIEIVKPPKAVAPRSSIVGNHGPRADNGDFTHSARESPPTAFPMTALPTSRHGATLRHLVTRRADCLS
eukprot:6213588-Pleurochrysis_carterae.AAC.8